MRISHPLLSIVIINYNTQYLLTKCLQNLVPGCQGLKSKPQIIVVDNASIDSSRSFLAETKDIISIINSQNLGYSRAVNQGFRQAKGEYLLLLNADIIPQKGSIRQLVEFAQKTTPLGLVGGKLLSLNRKPQASVFNFPTFSRAFAEYFLGKPGYSKYLPRVSQPVIVDAVVGAVMLIPRSTFRQAGYFNEDYFLYFEDLDYCRRLKKLNLPVFYHPQAEFVHYHGASGVNTPVKVNRYLRESSLRYFGPLRHFFINFTLYTGQKCQKLLP